MPHRLRPLFVSCKICGKLKLKGRYVETRDGVRDLIEHYELKYRRLLKVRKKNRKAGYADSVDRLDARLHEIGNFLILLRAKEGEGA